MTIKLLIRNKLIYAFAIVLFFPLFAFASNEKELIREGNNKFEQGEYVEAEAYYRRALTEDPGNHKALYNLASSLYRQNRFDEAVNILEGLSNTETKKIDKSDIYHNLGNALLSNRQIKESIESYKNALRIDPGDDDTRYNLAYAMKLLEEEESQCDDKCDGEQDEQDEENQQEDQQQDKEQEDDKQQPEQKEPQPTPEQLSQEDAERILDALNQQEQKIQEKIDREEAETEIIEPERQW